MARTTARISHIIAKAKDIQESDFDLITFFDCLHISRISRRTSSDTCGLPARRPDFHRQNERKPARCQRITVSGSRIATGVQDARCNSIQADEDQTIEITEDRALGRASTQHVQLMTQS